VRASQLRRLAADYARGELNTLEYRGRRRQLIQNIVSGRETLNYSRNFVNPLRSSQRGPRRAIWAVVGGLLLIGAVVVYLRMPDPAPASAPPRDPALAQNTAATRLIRDFLTNGDWSAHNMQQFEVAWHSLPAFERETARRAPVFRQLRAEWLQRIKEQDALAGLQAGNQATLRKKQLTRFGDDIGLANGTDADRDRDRS
jgi:hypothetical protein